MTYEIGKLSPYKRHWIAKNSNIPTRFWGWEPSDIIADKGDFPQDILDWLSDVNAGVIIKNPGGLGNTGVGLLFDGMPGMGKTTHAVTVLTEFVRNLPEDDAEARAILRLKPEDYGLKLRPVYYLTFTDLLQKKKAMFDADADERRELHREMEGFHGRADDDRLNVRLLVLDDLGKEYGSKYDDFSFDELLRARYDKGLPTIVTTNKSLEIWGTQYSGAMGSFAHEAFRRIQLTGDDLRKRNSA